MAPSVLETETPVAVDSKTQEYPQAPKPSGKRHEEYQYLDLIREILEDGEHRPDR
jgi:thymidylate synthase